MAKTRAARRRDRAQGKPLPLIPDMSWCAEQPGMVNGYRCRSGHVLYTLVSDPGVTAGMLICHELETRGNPPVTVECGQRAMSMFYRGIPSETTVTHEWFRPTDDERRRLTSYQADHVNRGGLLLRELPEPRVVTGVNVKEARDG